MADKGAHFFRCDLQVHTPRDISWTGSHAVTDDERRAYAKSLVQACRDKGLQGIALTDHHDMLFVSYVRQAAAEETEEAWRERMDAARAEAAKLAQDAREESARQTEAKVNKAAERINFKVEAAQGKIRDALESARAEIESVAAEATQELVVRLTGMKVDKKDAADAVKAELNV